MCPFRSDIRNLSLCARHGFWREKKTFLDALSKCSCRLPSYLSSFKGTITNSSFKRIFLPAVVHCGAGIYELASVLAANSRHDTIGKIPSFLEFLFASVHPRCVRRIRNAMTHSHRAVTRNRAILYSKKCESEEIEKHSLRIHLPSLVHSG